MRTLKLMTTVTVTLLLQSCSTPSRYPTEVASNIIHRQSVVSTVPMDFPVKGAHQVAIFTEARTPHAPYRIIGVAKVSKYNLLGMQRQDDTMHSMIKTLAASIGGDGVIDIDHTSDGMQAKVIAFQKILI